MNDLILMLNGFILACIAIFILHARKVYYRILKRLEAEKNACEQYRNEARKEVAKVKDIQSDVCELKSISLSNNILKRGR